MRCLYIQILSIDTWILPSLSFKHGCDGTNTALTGSSFSSVYVIYLPTACVYMCERTCLCWCYSSQFTLTPVSSLCGPRRVDIRAKPFEAGLIASCMTVWSGGVPSLHTDFIMSLTLCLTFRPLLHPTVTQVRARSLSVRLHAGMPRIAT